jgi:hypothetical protein
MYQIYQAEFLNETWNQSTTIDEENALGSSQYKHQHNCSMHPKNTSTVDTSLTPSLRNREWSMSYCCHVVTPLCHLPLGWRCDRRRVMTAVAASEVKDWGGWRQGCTRELRSRPYLAERRTFFSRQTNWHARWDMVLLPSLLRNNGRWGARTLATPSRS